MNDKELMQQALEALDAYSWEQVQAATTALRKRLAQPEMQPCAGRNCGSTNPNLHSAECFEDHEKSTGMNQWQGLTDEEILDATCHLGGWNIDVARCVINHARAIEAKLREKNHG